VFVQSPLHLLWRPDDEVQGKRRVQGKLDSRCHAELAAGRHDDEDVHIAVVVRGAIGVRAEEDDLLGMELLRHVAREAADDPHRDVLAAIPERLAGFGR
jgi:hypothetical protein